MSNNLDKALSSQIEQNIVHKAKDYTPAHRANLIKHLKGFEHELHKLMFGNLINGVTVEFNKDEVHFDITEYTLRIIIKETVETNKLEDIYWPDDVFKFASFRGAWGGLANMANSAHERLDLTPFVGSIFKGKYNYDLPSLVAYLKSDTTFVNQNRENYIVRKGKKKIGELWDLQELKSSKTDSILKWLNKINPELKGKQKIIILKFKITREQFTKIHRAIHTSYYENVHNKITKIAGYNIDNSVYIGNRLYKGSRHRHNFWFNIFALICVAIFAIGTFVFMFF